MSSSNSSSTYSLRSHAVVSPTARNYGLEESQIIEEQEAEEEFIEEVNWDERSSDLPPQVENLIKNWGRADQQAETALNDLKEALRGKSFFLFNGKN